MDGASDEDRLRSGEAGTERRRPAGAAGRTPRSSNARRASAMPRARSKATLFQDIDPAIRLAREPEGEPALEFTQNDGSTPVAAEPLPSVEPPVIPPEVVEPPIALDPSPPASEADLAGIVLSSRRDARAHLRFGQLALGLLKTGALRVGVLVALASGALYAGLFALKPGEAPVVATVRQPRMMTVKSIPVEPVAASDHAERLVVADYPDAYARAFGLNPSGLASSFVRNVPGAPGDACATLASAGWTTEGWGSSLVGTEGECLAERRYGADGETNNFAVLRGGETLSELRIKLNLGDATTRRAAARDAGRIVAMLFESWHWAGAEALEQRIAALRPFEETVLGTTVRLSREYGETERLNLFLRFPPSPGAPVPDFARTKAGSLIALAKAVGPGKAAGSNTPEPAVP